MSLWVTYNETTWVSDPESVDDDPWGWQGTTEMDVTLCSLHLSSAGYGSEQIREYDLCEGHPLPTDLVPGEKVYVVLARYYTGDTFGSDARWCVYGVTRYLDEADAIRTEAFGSQPIGRLRHWDGYFESLIDVQVDVLTVKA